MEGFGERYGADVDIAIVKFCDLHKLGLTVRVVQPRVF